VRVVVPFRAGGKSRLPGEIREEIALAMLGDVLEAATVFAPTRLVTDDPAAALVAYELRADVVDYPGGGQGAAVAAGLALDGGHVLVVNADLPCATPDALEALAAAGPALVAASDGTTNALSLPDRSIFRPLYGAGSAARFAAAGLVPASIPQLTEDVDTLGDLDSLTLPLGRRTRLVTDRHKARSATAR
jgi:2-phospho-L-lactate guanylyltransferase (CobY/MobA/RfbA family)